MENETDLIGDDLIVDSAIGLHLKETAGWGKFLSIAGFVYSALIAISGIYAATKLTKLPGNYNRNNGGAMVGSMVGFMYLAIAVVICIMSVYLLRFAKKIQVALQVNDQLMLSEAFKNLKIYFRVAGIIAVVALILSVLGVIRIIMAAAFRG